MSDFLVTFPPAFDEGGTFDKSGHIDDLYAWLLGHKNRPFPSSLVPLFHSQSKCKTILMKMALIYMRMNLHAELIFISKVSHLDSF